MATKVWLSVGLNHNGLTTPAFRLSQTIALGTQTKYDKARVWPSIQSLTEAPHSEGQRRGPERRDKYLEQIPIILNCILRQGNSWRIR